MRRGIDGTAKKSWLVTTCTGLVSQMVIGADDPASQHVVAWCAPSSWRERGIKEMVNGLSFFLDDHETRFGRKVGPRRQQEPISLAIHEVMTGLKRLAAHGAVGKLDARTLYGLLDKMAEAHDVTLYEL